MWRLVVSHYAERLDWIPSVGIPDVWVYHKGGNVTAWPRLPYVRRWIVVDNVGREAETIARHLSEEYHRLAPLTVFLQGDPAHNGHVIDTVRAFGKTEPLLSRFACRLLGAPILHADADGCPHHCGLAVQPTCVRTGSRRTSCEPPFTFAAGGQFIVRATRARRLGRARYVEIAQMLRREARYTRRAPLYPYIFERLWGRLLCD